MISSPNGSKVAQINRVVYEAYLYWMKAMRQELKFKQLPWHAQFLKRKIQKVSAISGVFFIFPQIIELLNLTTKFSRVWFSSALCWVVNATENSSNTKFPKFYSLFLSLLKIFSQFHSHQNFLNKELFGTPPLS